MATAQQNSKAFGDDPHSFSNFKEAIVTHLDIHSRVDFKQKIIFGHVDVSTEVVGEKGASQLLLDCKGIAIHDIFDVTQESQPQRVLFTLPQHHPDLGMCLRIPFPSQQDNNSSDVKAKGSKLKFRITYNTTRNSGGIQWLEAHQTTGKTHPFLFTQCQAILARTLVPCQDTPQVKQTYTLKVTVPSPLVAVCSGIREKEEPTQEPDGSLTYHYVQPLPTSAYLIAIGVGKLGSAKIGPRSHVWAEEAILERAVKEFESETERFIKAAEDLTGIPYAWNQYDLLVLPASFPYGGMENPNMTFFSMSLLAGDRSLTDVVAHEIAHSWTGNLVTNATWNDFWLNEGFTMYMERLILGRTRESEQQRHMEVFCGSQDLRKDIEALTSEGVGHFTRLIPDLSGIDPDDAFSRVPYEKGCLFLMYLEHLVGGKEVLLKWLHNYLVAFSKSSVTSHQMKEHFLNHFTSQHKLSDPSALNKIDWDAWFYGEGLPSVDVTAFLDKSLSIKSQELAQRWATKDGEGCSSSDLAGFRSTQLMILLDTLITEHVPIKHDTLRKMDQLYHLSTSGNVEVLYRWLMLGIKSGWKEIVPQVTDFLSKHGRGVYVKPLYKELANFDRPVASETYSRHRSFYHSVIHNTLDPVFNVK